LPRGFVLFNAGFQPKEREALGQDDPEHDHAKEIERAHAAFLTFRYSRLRRAICPSRPHRRPATADAIGDSAGSGHARTGQTAAPSPGVADLMATAEPFCKTNKPETSGFSLVTGQNYTDARR
jgi:hypothetical protein